ncbi:hypothetical protein O1M54_44925 [Streptomyces diastatochromogenes]|nr:hypothetical protein [Streptomyces diastatochromogenes]
MIVAAVLFAYAVLLGTLAPRLLGRARWTERAPRLGIVAWQALGVSALASAVMAGLALTVPTVRVSADLAQLLQACVMALTAQYASRRGGGGRGRGRTGPGGARTCRLVRRRRRPAHPARAAGAPRGAGHGRPRRSRTRRGRSRS